METNKAEAPSMGATVTGRFPTVQCNIVIKDVQVSVKHDFWHPGHVLVRATCSVPDASGSGQVVDLISEKHTTEWHNMPLQAQRELIRQAVAGMLLHELDEQLRVDGELVRDPHPELKGVKILNMVPQEVNLKP